MCDLGERGKSSITLNTPWVIYSARFWGLGYSVYIVTIPSRVQEACRALEMKIQNPYSPRGGEDSLSEF
jgi:hypothetical protein